MIALTANAQEQSPNSSQQTKTVNPFLRGLAPGKWWASLSEEAKDNFVDGYTTAMYHAYVFAHGFCMSEKDKLTPGPQFDAQLKEIMTLCALAEKYDFETKMQTLKTEINEFYKDGSNTLLPPEYAMEYCRDKLNGKKSAQELNDELTTWRRALSH